MIFKFFNVVQKINKEKIVHKMIRSTNKFKVPNGIANNICT